MLESKNAPMDSLAKETQVHGFEAVNKILFTNDLKKFKTMKGNRPVNPRHVKAIIRSISDNGMLPTLILVNEKYEVIDGQHRLEAARVLGVGVHYLVIKGYSITETHTLNLNQKNWKNQDYLASYAEIGYLDYVALQELQKENKDFKLGSLRRLCSNKYQRQRLPEEQRDVTISDKAFKDGTWQLLDLDEAELHISLLKELKPYYKNYSRPQFVAVMVDMFNNPKFDFEVFLKKVKLRPTYLIDGGNAETTRTIIEDLYNYKNKNKVNLLIKPTLD
jgi:hypothetical protein